MNEVKISDWRDMRNYHKIDFPQDVSDVLNIDCAELRSIYKNWRTEICNDAISVLPLGKWRCDGLSLTPLATRTNNEIVSLQDWYREEGDQHKPKIILILESPHKDEYVTRCDECSKGFKCGLYASPAPARGATGRNIKQMLPLLFGEQFNDYYIAFMNLIQYQCSLGADLSSGIKNTIVWGVFDGAYKDNFIDRFIKSYNPDFDIVIICTTGGEERRSEIFKLLESKVNDMRCVLSVPHPINWKRNRKRCFILKIKKCTNVTDKKIASLKFSESNSDELYCVLTGNHKHKSFTRKASYK